jgi:hypothetical protein
LRVNDTAGLPLVSNFRLNPHGFDALSTAASEIGDALEF